MARVFAEATVQLPSGPLHLVCDFRALASVERYFPIPTLMADFAAQRIAMTALAALVWGFAKARQPAITEDEALEIVLDNGEAISAAIGELLTVAFAHRAEKGAEKPDPLKAESGTG